jgi:hypothetical protein
MNPDFKDMWDSLKCLLLWTIHLSLSHALQTWRTFRNLIRGGSLSALGKREKATSLQWDLNWHRKMAGWAGENDLFRFSRITNDMHSWLDHEVHFCC